MIVALSTIKSHSKKVPSCPGDEVLRLQPENNEKGVGTGGRRNGKRSGFLRKDFRRDNFTHDLIPGNIGGETLPQPSFKPKDDRPKLWLADGLRNQPVSQLDCHGANPSRVLQQLFNDLCAFLGIFCPQERTHFRDRPDTAGKVQVDSSDKFFVAGDI